MVGRTRELLYKIIMQSSIHDVDSSGHRVALLRAHRLSQSYLSGPVTGHVDSEAVIWKLELVSIC